MRLGTAVLNRCEQLRIEAPEALVRFRRDEQRNLCDTGDCFAWFELLGDGTIRADVDLFDDGAVVTATVSSEDLDRAIAVFTEPELKAALGADAGGCPAPSEIRETMFLETASVDVDRVTTFCDDAALVRARDEVERLTEAYLTGAP